jgi:hypothetical protein
MLFLQSSYVLTLCWKGRVSELEEYLMELFLDKMGVVLAEEELEFTPDEIAHIKSLALESVLNSKSYKLHGVD